MNRMALVLAAGAGTRMLSSTPKILHKIAGIEMVEYVLRALDGVAEETCMVVGAAKERIMEALHGRARFIEQSPEMPGTGGAVRAAAEAIREAGVVLVVAADMPLLMPETLARLASAIEHGASCAILTAVADEPMGYGRVIRENGRVVAVKQFQELCADEFAIREINHSAYAFRGSDLYAALSDLRYDEQANETHLSDAVRVIAGRGLKVTTVPALEKSELIGVNDRIQLAQAEEAMRTRINKRHMRAGVTLIDPANTYIEPFAVIGRDTVVYPGCQIERDTTIGEKCVLIASRVSGAHVGAGARIERSVVVDATIKPGQSVGPFELIRAGRR